MVIGIWGDSITYGRSDDEALGWGGRILRYLYTKDTAAHVYNRGVCGNTTVDLLSRLDNELKTLNPDIVLLSSGVNDSKSVQGIETPLVSLEDYASNIEALIRIARAYTKRIIIIGLTNITDIDTPHGSRFSNDLVRTYDETLRAHAEREGLQFVSLFGLLDVETDIADGLHPNARGYDKIAAKILAEVDLIHP